jgi:hypothetical protein
MMIEEGVELQKEQHAIERIDRQRRLFSSFKTNGLSHYLERERKSIVTDRLVTLNGWSNTYHNTYSQMPLQLFHLLLPNQVEAITRSGGYWLQIAGTGIAINPGLGFLERMHKAGYHIWDIDHIIVTDGEIASSSEIEKVYSFNKEINSLLQQWELDAHIISYHLHPKAYEQYAARLRPTSRKEISTVHCLETFSLSPETIELSEHVSLDFCTATPLSSSSLMIRIRRHTEGQELNRIGFLTNSATHTSQADFFENCQTLILGIGKSSFEEAGKSLGYEGVINLIDKENAPKTVILAEQDFSEGDTRLEVLHYIYEQLSTEYPSLLPSEEGLTIHLDTLQVTTPSLQTPTPINAIKIIRSQGPFSNLSFLDGYGIL